MQAQHRIDVFAWRACIRKQNYLQLQKKIANLTGSQAKATKHHYTRKKWI